MASKTQALTAWTDKSDVTVGGSVRHLGVALLRSYVNGGRVYGFFLYTAGSIRLWVPDFAKSSSNIFLMAGSSSQYSI